MRASDLQIAILFRPSILNHVHSRGARYHRIVSNISLDKSCDVLQVRVVLGQDRQRRRRLNGNELYGFGRVHQSLTVKTTHVVKIDFVSQWVVSFSIF